jgi:hypothetical protein
MLLAVVVKQGMVWWREMRERLVFTVTVMEEM